MVLGLIAAYYLGKTKGIKVVVEPEKEIPTGTTLAQSWSAFDQDTRSFEELLAKARIKIKGAKNE